MLGLSTNKIFSSFRELKASGKCILQRPAKRHKNAKSLQDTDGGKVPEKGAKIVPSRIVTSPWFQMVTKSMVTRDDLRFLKEKSVFEVDSIKMHGDEGGKVLTMFIPVHMISKIHRSWVTR